MRSRGLLLSMAISAITLAATSAPAWATFPGTNGRIAFATDATGELDIFTMQSNGLGLFNVTGDPSAPGFAIEPDYSPDGSKIAFRGGRVAGAEIYTANTDGSGLVQLTSNAFKDYTPAWSPDGTRIAFASNRNDPDPTNCVGLFGPCVIDIFVMPATGGAPVQVTFGPGTKHFPQFSPDGGSIAYTSNAGGTFAVYRVDLATLATTKLTADSLHAGPPDYSPDGTKIVSSTNNLACNTGTADCRTSIFVMNADGSSIARLTEKFGNNYDPTWSPEGNQIVFTHAVGAGFKHQQIYTMNPDGTGITRIAHNNDENFGPDWGSG